MFGDRRTDQPPQVTGPAIAISYALNCSAGISGVRAGERAAEGKDYVLVRSCGADAPSDTAEQDVALLDKLAFILGCGVCDCRDLLWLRRISDRRCGGCEIRGAGMLRPRPLGMPGGLAARRDIAKAEARRVVHSG